MPDDIAKLGLEITSDDVLKAMHRLDKLEDQSKKNERQNKKLQRTNKDLSGSFGMLRAAVVGVIGALGARKFLETAGAFESMSASLETVTGSAEKAAAAMAGIREFAKETPFQVREITDAFIKLKALGLTPSEEALTSFGNTASAMGKSLNQMIEAVADAATGEFERLKEFGIKARSEGDNVSFTFQGVTTTVRKNANEISGYLEGLGKVQFAGAMARQMDTINGKISNLSDSFDNLLVTYAEAGAGGGTKGALDSIIDAVDYLTRGVEMLPGIFVALISEFDIMATRFAFGGRRIYENWVGIFDSMEETAERRKKLNDEEERQVGIIQRAAQQYIEAEERKREARALTAELESKGGAAGAAEEAGFEGEDELEKLREKYATEYELLQEKIINEQMLIDEALVAGELREEEHEQLMTRINEKYARAREKLAKDEARGRERAISSMMNNLISLMNTGSKKLFQIGKIAAIAQATVDTYKGAQSAFADTPGPIWLKVAAGIAATAAGVARVASIAGTSFGGGGPSPATTASTTGGQPVTGSLPPPASTPTATAQEVNITIVGRTTAEDVRDLIGEINDQLGDNVQLNVDLLPA